MRLKLALGLLLLFITFFVKAGHNIVRGQDSILIKNETSAIVDEKDLKNKTPRKHVRAKAILFTILTGPLGGHRVYLRTRPGAPIVYAVTLGGFGILPLVDLAHLIFKKDISSFEENPKIMMWSK